MVRLGQDKIHRLEVIGSRVLVDSSRTSDPVLGGRRIFQKHTIPRPFLDKHARIRYKIYTKKLILDAKKWEFLKLAEKYSPYLWNIRFSIVSFSFSPIVVFIECLHVSFVPRLCYLHDRFNVMKRFMCFTNLRYLSYFTTTLPVSEVFNVNEVTAGANTSIISQCCVHRGFQLHKR